MCSSALLCFAVLRVAFFASLSCALLWTTKAKKRTPRSYKMRLPGGQKWLQNHPKLTPGGLPGASGGLWAPSGGRGGSQERSQRAPGGPRGSKKELWNGPGGAQRKFSDRFHAPKGGWGALRAACGGVRGDILEGLFGGAARGPRKYGFAASCCYFL